MKKFLSLLLAFTMLISLSIPVFAIENLNPELPTDNITFTDAYINFSDQLNELGISASTCFEDFVNGYKCTSYDSLQQYIDSSIDKEIINATEYESIISNNIQYALEHSDQQNEYATPYSVASKWYDNIGTSSPTLTHAAQYDKYNILSNVKKGDILQETAGLIAQYTGHIAIIQGKYWDSTYGQFYIRTIEAGAFGVVYGVLDDTRVDQRGVYMHYVKDAASQKIDGAINFCINQLGKPYNWDGILGAIEKCHISTEAPAWYCSELVWSAYYKQGINIYGTGTPKNIYRPENFAASSKLGSRNI